MSPASKRTCHSVKSAAHCLLSVNAQEPELISARARWLNDFFASSRGACRCDAVPLTRRFQRIWPRFRTVKIAPINECCTGVHSGQKKNEQEGRQPFHGVDTNRNVKACQCLRLRRRQVGGCAMPMLKRHSLSVRGYGSRTYETRQGRNAATVV